MTKQFLFTTLSLSAFLITSCSQVGEPSPRARAALDDDATIPHGCTTIMVGRLATVDGSVITSHTCDANYRTWLRIVPAADHPQGGTTKIHKGLMHNEFPGDLRGVELMGEIPQVAHTYAFIDTAYPAMNEHQLAMGESTFGGKQEMRSQHGMFYIEELQRLALARCRTAREAIRLMGGLALEHGYLDGGETLTVADPREVWHFEILGPGKGKKGAVWAAVRIPDDHVGVSANIARIGELDLEDADRCMASPNVVSLAQELGFFDPGKGEPFKFWKAYSGQKPFRAREFHIFNTLAPSLGLDFDEAEELPFSIKPERKLSVRDIFAFWRDTYEGTRFDLGKNLVLKQGKDPKPSRSAYANPWLDRGQRNLYNALKSGTIEYHRPIPVMYNAYNTVLQCRSWLPDSIGGLCWLGYDNPATTPRAPIFCGVRDVPADFKVDNQHRFRRDSAAWAFRRASRLASIKWGANQDEVLKRILRFEEKAMAELPAVEREALKLHETSPEQAREFLTEYSMTFCRSMTHEYWEFGDELWMQYRFRM